MVDPKKFFGRSRKNPLSIKKKLHGWSRKKSMADPEKKYIVDPDPVWNNAIPDFAIPFTFPLTSPGQTKWLTGSHPTLARFCCVPIVHHMPSPFVYDYMRVLR